VVGSGNLPAHAGRAKRYPLVHWPSRWPNVNNTLPGPFRQVSRKKSLGGDLVPSAENLLTTGSEGPIGKIKTPWLLR